MVVWPRSHFKTYALAYDNAMASQANVGGKTWRGEDSPNNNGMRSASISHTPRLPHGVGVLALRIAGVLRASSGSSGRAPNGANCRGDMAAPAPVGGGSSTGKKPACCSSSGGFSSRNSMTSRSCVGMNALRMGALSRPKKGGQGREAQAGQGHEVDGSGRWHGYSVGSISGGGFPGRSRASRKDARHGRGRASRETRPAP